MRNQLLDEETSLALLAIVPRIISVVRYLPAHRREDAAMGAVPLDKERPETEAEVQTTVLYILAGQFALQAFAPGGVTDFGIHACVDLHDGCPAARAWSPYLGAICRTSSWEAPGPPNLPGI